MTVVQAADRGGPRTGAAMPASLTVYYDPTCELCRRCRAWLEVQPTWVPVAFVAATAAEAQVLLPQIPWLDLHHRKKTFALELRAGLRGVRDKESRTGSPRSSLETPPPGCNQTLAPRAPGDCGMARS